MGFFGIFYVKKRQKGWDMDVVVSESPPGGPKKTLFFNLPSRGHQHPRTHLGPHLAPLGDSAVQLDHPRPRRRRRRFGIVGVVGVAVVVATAAIPASALGGPLQGQPFGVEARPDEPVAA